MNTIPGGMRGRGAFGSALVGIGLAITSAGLLAAAPTANATPDPDVHCPDHTTSYKYSAGGTTTATIGGVPVTITVTGGSVSFTDAEGDPVVVTYCLKGGTDNTGKQTGSSGTTDAIPNNGGNAPDISYVVVYAVAMAATLAPALRAARIRPAEALRYQ